MTRYSVQPRDWTFVTFVRFLLFARNMGENDGKSITKTLSSKYSQKRLDHAKKPATDAFKTASKWAIRKTAAETGDLIGNKIPDKVTWFSKTSLKNNSEANEKEMYRERYLQN